MKKVLMINGSPHEAGCTFTALSEIEASLKKHGIESDLLYLGKKPLSGCTDCGFCAKAGKCVFEDAVNETIARLDQYDAIVAGTPVYYGGPSGQLCCFMDRLCFAGGSRLAGKLAASVVSCRRGGATSAFQRLNQYFAMNNMCLVGSQYWNQVHGFTPEDVRQDLEGLQTMRTLGENMAWMMKNMEAGRNAGVNPPEYEPVIMTHFIR
ncbi:MAG TPA: flavodoxin family protein [Candidatus Scatomonas merdigallinarum]|nr:flavodoxin family protein [Candidatus Scatomonas merdigallinarum]